MSPLLLFHVAISLVGIVTGFVVAVGLLGSKRLDGWTLVFLATTVLTSVTGFPLPAEKILPSHIVGVLSLVVLAIAVFARYSKAMAGGWRRTFVITAMIAQYFNCFVLVAQLFSKVPTLHDLAPTQSEPPFAIAQLLLLIFFVWLTYRAVKSFHPAPVR